MYRPDKIISGGQTGADIGGLIGAKRAGIKTGGTAPRGYKTEKGPQIQSLKYLGLVEHPSEHYRHRTQQIDMSKKEKASSRCAKARSGDWTAKLTDRASCGVRFFFGDTAPEALLKWLLELKEASSRWRRLPGVWRGANTLSWASCWSIFVGAALLAWGGLALCVCRPANA